MRSWLVLLAACSQSGTGVMLRLVGSGSVDAVEVVGHWGASSEKSGAAMGRAVDLPFDVLVQMAETRVSARFDVTARRSGEVVGQGSTPPVLVLPRQISQITVTLDQAADLGAGDDLAADDLGELRDLEADPDLSRPDLAPPPVCSGASTCTDGGTTPCTGFESGAVDAPFQMLARTGCTVTVDGSRACRGAKSLHVTLPAAAGGSPQLEAMVFEQSFLPSGTFYLRAFVYLVANLPTDSYLLQAYQSFSPFEGITLVTRSSGTMLIGNSVANQSSPTSALKLPLGRWVCVEWKIVSATGATGSLQLFVDGSEVTDVAQTAVATQPTPPFNSVAVGLTSMPATAVGASELWVDEIRMDTSPIGCKK